MPTARQVLVKLRTHARTLEGHAEKPLVTALAQGADHLSDALDRIEELEHQLKTLMR